MSDDQLERLLKTVPVRTLPALAEREIVAAVRAAGKRRRPWWNRPIPIWQAAAACLIVCVTTWLFAEHQESAADGAQGIAPRLEAGDAPAAPNTVFVRLDEPIFPENRQSIDRIDIARWRPLNSD